MARRNDCMGAAMEGSGVLEALHSSIQVPP
jgi:hypothetical protein